MPNLTVSNDSPAASVVIDYKAQTELLRAQLIRAQQRMKSYADKNRTERQFQHVAYRLQLPVSAQVHPVFHVSQLKPFTPNYTPVYTDIPAVPDLTTLAPVPVAILDRRMVRKGNAAAPQILIQWAHVPPECATR